jgi:hypothetical protein
LQKKNELDNGERKSCARIAARARRAALQSAAVADEEHHVNSMLGYRASLERCLHWSPELVRAACTVIISGICGNRKLRTFVDRTVSKSAAAIILPAAFWRTTEEQTATARTPLRQGTRRTPNV